MATKLLDRVPLGRIQAEAKPVDLGRVLLVLVVGVFYLLGWLAAKVVAGLGVALSAVGVGVGWAWAATKTGWVDGRRPADGRVRGGG